MQGLVRKESCGLGHWELLPALGEEGRSRVDPPSIISDPSQLLPICVPPPQPCAPPGTGAVCPPLHYSHSGEQQLLC